MALDAPQIHGMRQIFRDLTDDEEFLSKEMLTWHLLNDVKTQNSVRHISGFVFHALREGTFETALNRMKTKKPNFLSMDEFLAFVNTSAIRMAKGESPNLAGLYDDRIPGSVPPGLVEDGGGPGVDIAALDDSQLTHEELAKRQQQADRRAHRKMMSSTDLGKLLRPRSGGHGSSKKRPVHLTKSSPFSVEASVVTPRTSKRMSGSLRPPSSTLSRGLNKLNNNYSTSGRQSLSRSRSIGKRPKTSSGIRPLSATAFGVGSRQFFEQSTANAISGSRRNVRPKTAGVSGLSQRRSVAGGSTFTMENSMLSFTGSAVEEFEWQQQPEFVINPTAMQAPPPNALLAGRVIDQEQKIREMGLTILKLTRQQRIDQKDLASARTEIARLQGTLRSVSSNNSARKRPGTAPVRRKKKTRAQSTLSEDSMVQDGDKTDTDASNDFISDEEKQTLLNNMPADMQQAIDYAESGRNIEGTHNQMESADAMSLTYVTPTLNIKMKDMEERIHMLQSRNDSLLSAVGVIRGQKGRKYNRPSLRPNSSRRRQFLSDRHNIEGQKSPEEIFQALHREIAYSTSLEEEVVRRGEKMRRLEHKCNRLEKREYELRIGAKSRNEKLQKLQTLIESLESRDRRNSKLIMNYRSKIKSDMSVEQKILRVCRAICVHYDKREARGAETENVGLDAGALKAGVSALSKHILEQDAELRQREEDIKNHKREERKLNERIDMLAGEIKRMEFEVELAQAHAEALKSQFENNAARSILDAGSSIGSSGSAFVFDANDSIVMSSSDLPQWEKTARLLFSTLDTDNDGYIHRREFTLAILLDGERDPLRRRVAELKFQDSYLLTQIKSVFHSEKTSQRIFSACQCTDGSGNVDCITLRKGFEDFDLYFSDEDFGSFLSLFGSAVSTNVSFMLFDSIFRALKPEEDEEDSIKDVKDALDLLPALKHQLMPKSYLNTVSDIFSSETGRVSLDGFLRYLSMLRRFMNVPGAKLGTFRMPTDHQNFTNHVSAENSIQLSVSSIESVKDQNIWIAQQERKTKEEKEKRERKAAERKAFKELCEERRKQNEEKKLQEIEGPYRINRRVLPKRKQLDVFQHLLVKEMGNDVSRIVNATVRLRHVLASATAIARSSQRKFNDTVVRVMNECAQLIMRIPSIPTAKSFQPYKAMNCERASLFIVDQEKEKLEAYIGSSQRIYLNINEGIAGAAARGNQTIIVNDTSKDPRFSSSADKKSGFKTRNIMACPGHDEHHKCIVVLEAINRFGSGDFTMLDEILLEIISDIAGCFVSHAKKNRDLERALQQRQLVMNTVPSLWGGFLEMDKVRFLQSIEDVVRNAVGAIVVCIYIRDMTFSKESESDKEVKRQREERLRGIRRDMANHRGVSKNKRQVNSDVPAQVMCSLDVHRGIIRSSRSYKVMTSEHHRASVWRKVKFIQASFDQPGQGVVAQVMRNGIPHCCEDAYSDLSYNPLVDMDIKGLATIIQPVVNKEGIVIACIQAVFPTLRNRNKELLSEISAQLPPLFAATSVIDSLNGRSVAEQNFVMRKATVQIQSLFRQRRSRLAFKKKKESAKRMQAATRGWRTRRRISEEDPSIEKGKMSCRLLMVIEEDEDQNS